MEPDSYEGVGYEELLLPGNDPDEKDTMRELFSRLEEKMPIAKGMDVRARNEKPYVYQEFPCAMFHRKLADRIVADEAEKQKYLKEGWRLNAFPKAEQLLAQIDAAEEALARLVKEYEQLTGLNYDDEIAKQELKDKNKK